MTGSIKIGNKEFNLGERTFVMGILNVTPDSFSDGGSYDSVEAALEYVEEMISDGVDIIDIGGESTRPNYTSITDEEEIQRVVPIIKAIKEKFDIPLSIDTYKSQVAKAAILAGADLINDIWGLKYDEEMAKIVKENNVTVCIMHNRSNCDYNKDFMKDIMKDLEESLEIAENAGIHKKQIILDPGVGFAKTYEMNLEIVNRLEEFLQFDMPILLGTSRKSVIGIALDLPVTEREEGTIATTVMAVMKGCHFVRVHNIKGNVRAIKMTEKIRKSKGSVKVSNGQD